MAIPNSTQPGSRPSPSKTTRPSRRPHRVDPYAEPDTGGVIARSVSPRPLTITLDLTDAARLIKALDSNITVTDIHAAITKKLAWTLAYNANLPVVLAKGKNQEATVTQKPSPGGTAPLKPNQSSKRPRKRPGRQSR